MNEVGLDTAKIAGGAVLCRLIEPLNKRQGIAEYGRGTQHSFSELRSRSYRSGPHPVVMEDDGDYATLAD